MYPSLLRPKSKGSIKLRSSNPHDYPIIEPNYYSAREDVETMREGLKWAYKMSQTEVFRKNKLEPVVDKYHCGTFKPFSDDYYECFLRHWSHTIYHPAGTCKMGPKTDSLAVVDAELKVHGIQNLRVIDASIMPALVSGNTNAPSIMIGEKGSSMVISQWGMREKDKFEKNEL